MITARYVRACLLSGAVWGLLCLVLSLGVFGWLVLGGVLLSPPIGVVIGLAFRWTHDLSKGLRIVLALVSLYTAAALFGLSIGIADLATGAPGRHAVEVVVQPVPAVWWGLTFMGYVLVLWPLAYWNHALLARYADG